MYALVFWVKYKTISILNVKELFPEKDEGEESVARNPVNNKLSRAKIVKKNDNKEYLRSLGVSMSGEIVKQNYPSNLVTTKDKQEFLRKRKLDLQNEEAAKKSRVQEIIKEESIAQNDNKTDSDEGNDEDDNLKILRLEETLRRLREKTKNQETNPPTTSIDNLATDSNDTENPLNICRKSGDDRILLCDNFDIWIDKKELTSLWRWRNRPKEMARRLLKILVGKENLKKMCARGRSKLTPAIPADIMSCVEYYVNEHCNVPLDTVEFTNVVNSMCATLRNSKLKIS